MIPTFGTVFFLKAFLILMKITLNLRFAQDIVTNMVSDGVQIKRIVQPQINGHLMASQCRERGISLRHSKLLYQQTGVLLPVGSRELLATLLSLKMNANFT